MWSREEALWWIGVEADLDHKFGVDLGTVIASRLQDFACGRPDSIFSVSDMLVRNYCTSDRLEGDFTALAESEIISVDAAEEGMFGLFDVVIFSENGDCQFCGLNSKTGVIDVISEWSFPSNLEEIYGGSVDDEVFHGKVFRDRIGGVIQTAFIALFDDFGCYPSAQKAWDSLKHYDSDGVIIEQSDTQIVWEKANRAMTEIMIGSFKNRLVKLRRWHKKKSQLESN